MAIPEAAWAIGLKYAAWPTKSLPDRGTLRARRRLLSRCESKVKQCNPPNSWMFSDRNVSTRSPTAAIHPVAPRIKRWKKHSPTPSSATLVGFGVLIFFAGLHKIKRADLLQLLVELGGRHGAILEGEPHHLHFMGEPLRAAVQEAEARELQMLADNRLDANGQRIRNCRRRNLLFGDRRRRGRERRPDRETNRDGASLHDERYGLSVSTSLRRSGLGAWKRAEATSRGRSLMQSRSRTGAAIG
jgi:hypothetical protein